MTGRILPFPMLAYFVAFIDRVNAGFAALQVNQDIGPSAARLWGGAPAPGFGRGRRPA